MVSKRIIPCLDVKDGRTVKGVNFLNLRDAGDPVELAFEYSKKGADELVFLDISATEEKRKTLLEMVKAVARQISIPFTIGGGITQVSDAYDLLNAGADKISINSAAVRNPELIEKMANLFGSQFVVVAVDTRKIEGEQKVHLVGGKVPTGRLSLDWMMEAQNRGAGEFLLTSMDHDGTKNGFDLDFLKEVNQKISVPLIASGGAGNMLHFLELFEYTEVDAALAATIFHYQEIEIPALKSYLHQAGVHIRPIN